MLFFLAISVIFRYIVSVPPTTVDFTKVKQTNLSSNKALFSPYHLALAVDDMQLFTKGSKSIHTLVVFTCLFYWILVYWIHISTMHLQKCDYCQRVFNGGLKRDWTLHDQILFLSFVNLQKKKKKSQNRSLLCYYQLLSCSCDTFYYSTTDSWCLYFAT